MKNADKQVMDEWKFLKPANFNQIKPRASSSRATLHEPLT